VDCWICVHKPTHSRIAQGKLVFGDCMCANMYLVHIAQPTADKHQASRDRYKASRSTRKFGNVPQEVSIVRRVAATVNGQFESSYVHQWLQHPMMPTADDDERSSQIEGSRLLLMRRLGISSNRSRPLNKTPFNNCYIGQSTHSQRLHWAGLRAINYTVVACSTHFSLWLLKLPSTVVFYRWQQAEWRRLSSVRRTFYLN